MLTHILHVFLYMHIQPYCIQFVLIYVHIYLYTGNFSFSLITRWLSLLTSVKYLITSNILGQTNLSFVLVFLKLYGHFLYIQMRAYNMLYKMKWLLLHLFYGNDHLLKVTTWKSSPKMTRNGHQQTVPREFLE